MQEEHDLPSRDGQWSEAEIAKAMKHNGDPLILKEVFENAGQRITVREIFQLKEDMLEKQIPFSKYLLLDKKIMDALK